LIRARVAFFCGFLHGVIFCADLRVLGAEVLSVDGGIQPRRLGSLFSSRRSCGVRLAFFTWIVQRLSQKELPSSFRAPFLWISNGGLPRLSPEISFPWGLLGYPAAGNPALVQLPNYGHLWDRFS